MVDPLVVCPVCHGHLFSDDPAVQTCDSCGTTYGTDAGYPVLLVPGDARFEDEADCCLYAAEERTNTFTAQSYHLPLLSRLVGPDLRSIRVLSAGCGVGADVDIYCDIGIEAHGVDCGSRVEAWSRRRYPEAFQIGSVANLPYPDVCFDAVVTGCLLPHIGVVGDSVKLRPDAAARRARVAAELLRVTRPGGRIIMGNPNRLCPTDLFHKKQMAGPGSLVRWHGPGELFLLSYGDYVEMFGAGASLATLPVAGYWGFHTKEEHLPTRILVRILKAYLALLSLPPLDILRRSPLNPWLMVLATKARA